jgi:hypothetical protein
MLSAAQENISAGKGRELILGLLFGGLTWDDLPVLNADEPRTLERICTHERLDEDGICRACGEDRRGIG